MSTNFISKLKNILITLVFLIAISSNCFAGEDDVVPYQDIFKVVESRIQGQIKLDQCNLVSDQDVNVLEFNQCILLPKIKENKQEYKYLNKYLIRDGEEASGICELLSDYVVFRQLLNERSADQLLSTEIILHDLETVIRVVQENTKDFEYANSPNEEEIKLINKINYYFFNFTEAFVKKQTQLMNEAFTRFESTLKDLWEEIRKNGKVPEWTIDMFNTRMSPYNVFTLDKALSIVRKVNDEFTINEQVFIDGMKAIEPGTYVSFVVTSDINAGPAHKMLIAKNQDNSFAFFDPNTGMTFNLTLEKLFKLTNDTFKYYSKHYECTRVLFLDNIKLLERIKSKFEYPVIPYFLSHEFYLY